MQPTKAELAILKAAWHLKTASEKELHDHSVGVNKWSLSSTRKTIARMVSKGLLIQDKRHGVKVYCATNPRLKTIASLIADFTKDILESDSTINASAFADSKHLNHDEIDDLQELLESLSQEKHKANSHND